MEGGEHGEILRSEPPRLLVIGHAAIERALEIFSASGDEETFPSPEKALDEMYTGPLFGNRERLLDLLHATATPPPLLSRQLLEELTENHLKRVGDGGGSSSTGPSASAAATAAGRSDVEVTTLVSQVYGRPDHATLRSSGVVCRTVGAVPAKWSNARSSMVNKKDLGIKVPDG